MTQYIGLSGKIYNLQNAAFAGGGEGDVYEVIGFSEFVAKIYKPDKRTTERERKLSVMVNNKPSMMDQYAWPLDVIYDNGHFMGYIMPKVNGKEKLRNIYVYDRRQGKPWSLFIAIAKNLAAAVHNVHEINQVVGDLNPENILVNPINGMVTLVDTDSYHISDSNRTYRCMVGMPEFVAPELQGIHFPSAPLPTFSKESDRFALAVLIFALLMNGSHPFSCKVISGSSSKFQPIDNMRNGKCAFFSDSKSQDMEIPRYAPDINTLPDNICKLFRRAFIDGHNSHSQRPSAEEWYNVLEQLENNLKTCLKNPQHIYYYDAKECPWCKVNEKMHSISQSMFSGSSISNSNAIPTVQPFKPTQTTISGSQQPSNSAQTQNIRPQNTTINSVNATTTAASTPTPSFTPSNYQYTPSSNSAINSVSNIKKKQNKRTMLIILFSVVGAYILFMIVSIAWSAKASKRQAEEAALRQELANEQSYYIEYQDDEIQNEESSTSDIIADVVKVEEDSYKTLDADNIFVGNTIDVDASEESIIDISSSTCVCDQISDYDQENNYSFTAPRDGRYYFDLTDIYSGTGYVMEILDDHDYSIHSTTDEYISIDLEKDKTYKLIVSQHYGLGSYKLIINFPKEAVDITGYDTVNDSTQYDDQVNRYLFTAPRDGRYYFDLTETYSGTGYVMEILDDHDYSIRSTTDEYISIDLEKDKTYKLNVSQHYGHGSYKMLIGYQKETKEASGDMVMFSDSTTFTDQENIYLFTPSTTADYQVSLNNVDSDASISILIYDDYGYEIKSTRDESFYVSLEANRTYKIKACQNYGYSKYDLIISR